MQRKYSNTNTYYISNANTYYTSWNRKRLLYYFNVIPVDYHCTPVTLMYVVKIELVTFLMQKIPSRVKRCHSTELRRRVYVRTVLYRFYNVMDGKIGYGICNGISINKNNKPQHTMPITFNLAILKHNTSTFLLLFFFFTNSRPTK